MNGEPRGARGVSPSVGGQPVHPLCPECATPAAEVEPRVAWWYRWRWVFQAVGFLAFFTFLGVMQWRHPLIAPNVHRVPPGVHSVDFPPERFTRAELEEMAAAGSAAGQESRLPEAMGEMVRFAIRDDVELCAALLAPAGEASAYERWGWPTTLVSRNYVGTYEDMYARTGLTPPNLRGRKGWMYDAWWDEGIDPVMGRWTFLIVPYRLGSSMALLVIAWITGAVVAWLLRRVLKRGEHRARAWTLRAMPAGATLVMLGVIVALSLRRDADNGYMLPPMPWPPAGPTGITIAELRGLRGQPGADRIVARAILEGARAAPSTGDTLAIGWYWVVGHSSRQIMGLWPHALFDGHAYDQQLDGREGAVWGDTRWSAEASGGHLVVRRAEVGGLERYRQYTIGLSSVGWVFLGLVAAWVVPGVPARGAMWWQRRRTRRRVARGQCARCGYDGVRGTAIAAESPGAA